jgi:hypothetical protein
VSRLHNLFEGIKFLAVTIFAYIIFPLLLLLLVGIFILWMLDPNLFGNTFDFLKKPLTLGDALFLIFFANVYLYEAIKKLLFRMRGDH